VVDVMEVVVEEIVVVVVEVAVAVVDVELVAQVLHVTGQRFCNDGIASQYAFRGAHLSASTMPLHCSLHGTITVPSGVLSPSSSHRAWHNEAYTATGSCQRTASLLSKQ
jgi:hypothetical protein